ncbi:MAG: S-methyl-5-thioribose-1-phosphate isomerase [Legionellales bacterium]|nr:S-methyl-5-thioribose-1-phosphate isomerase [Legionellales bacterium]
MLLKNKKSKQHIESFSAVKWDAGNLVLLDQRKLPNEVIYKRYSSAFDTANAIKEMVVRGAPAIGIAAAYAVVLAAISAYEDSPNSWRTDIEKSLEALVAARPTAVNLNWAISRMREEFHAIDGDPEEDLLKLAIRIHDEDISANHEMGRLGAELINPNSKVITHCNAGALATGGYGTALGVIRTAHKKGLLAKVFASETRPWFQGARLTSWELKQDNIPVSLLIDSAVSSLMRSENISWLIVGSDRITANGDIANKIGTYSHALSAKYHGVKVMVVAPSSTIDMNIESGEKIPIEERSANEVMSFEKSKNFLNESEILNPAFDITPASLVDCLVTEKGIIHAPDIKKMHAVFG